MVGEGDVEGVAVEKVEEAGEVKERKEVASADKDGKAERVSVAVAVAVAAAAAAAASRRWFSVTTAASNCRSAKDSVVNCAQCCSASSARLLVFRLLS